MKKRSVMWTVALLSTVTLVSAHAQSNRLAKPWSAQWIAASGGPQRDEVILHFRKMIELAQAPDRFRINVSADNQFILYVNGRWVGTGPCRADLAHWRFETYDLGPFLHAGRNVLAATVWHFGTHAALAQMSDRAGFLVHGESEVERAADTNASWDVEQDRGIETLRPQVHGYYAAEPGERWNASAFDWLWNGSSGRGGGAWTEAVVLGRGALRGETDPPNNWQLVADPLPAMEMKEVPAGKVVRTSGIVSYTAFPQNGFAVPAHTKAAILLDHQELVTGYPALALSGGAGARLRLTYAEALVDDRAEKGNRNEITGKHIAGLVDEFLADGPAHEFRPLTWRTWRYLQIDMETADKALHVDGLRTWFTAFPFERRAWFWADDPALKAIWDIGWRTARLDAHDTYMDTPYWERLQYVGDTRIQALISYAVAGDDRLARQAIEAYDDSRIPDGLTQSRYPSSLVQMIPTFSLLWVGMVHDFWVYRGDAAFARAQLPGVRAVLEWYERKVRPDGLLGRLPWWPFVDWGKDFEFGMPPQEEDGGSSIITLQFVEALRDAADLEAALGDAQRADEDRAVALKSAVATQKLCWNEKYGLVADTPAQTHFSQHANILAVWLDVIGSDRQKEVLTKILSTSDRGFEARGPAPPMTAATYYFRFYLARALEHTGMGDEYLKLLGPFKQMVALGLTTWAESPEPTRSDSHAWSAHPNYDLLTVVAGIRPKRAGFEQVLLEPHMGDLKHVEAGFPLRQGMVELEYRATGTRFEAQVKLPEGITGELVWKGRTVELRAGAQKIELEK